MIKRISYWFRSWKLIESVERAEKMGLKFHKNVYGDEINYVNCRSIWYDEYRNVYRCKTLNKEL